MNSNLRRYTAGRAWQEPQKETAFLCNLDQHWFTVRYCYAPNPTVHGPSAGGGWWNFNSMFPVWHVNIPD
jgi:hypothetical protein